MKVVHLGIGVVPVPPGDIAAGREEYIYQLTNHLGRLGCQVVVIDIKWGHLPDEKRQQSSAKFYELRHFPLPYKHNFPILHSFFNFLLMTPQFYLFAFLSSFKLNKILNEGEVNIIHTHDGITALSSIIVNKLKGKPAITVYTPQVASLFTKLPWIKRLSDFPHFLAQEWVDHIVTLTPAFKDWLVHELNFDPGKITSIQVGAALEEIEQFLADKHLDAHYSNVLLCVGGISKRKNQLTLVKAMSQVIATHPDTKLFLVGPIVEKDYFDSITRFIIDNKLVPYVEFKGEVTRHELYTFYSETDIFVFPSKDEVQPAVLMEALAFGLPIIASNIRGIEDVIKQKEGSAILVDPNDANNIAKKIVQLFDDDSMRKMKSQKAKELAQMLSYKNVAAQTLTLYNKLIQKKYTDLRSN